MFKVNISIDDVSPHPKSSTKVLEQCYNLINDYPSIKFTLFVPMAYWRTMKPVAATERPLFISQYLDFCNELKSLSGDNFEIGYHGFYHGIPFHTDNDEFRDLDYKQALGLFSSMHQEAKKAGLLEVFKPIFRPPAWRMSPDAIKASKDVGIKILALSPDKYPDGSLDYEGEDEKFGDVVYYNVCPPFKSLQLYEKTEIVYHACEWDSNYLDSEKTNQLRKLLSDEAVQFCFMEEMI